MIRFNTSCFRQAHSSRPVTDDGYENMEPGCIIIVLCVLFKIHPQEAQMPTPVKLKSQLAVQNFKIALKPCSFLEDFSSDTHQKKSSE